MFYCPILRTWCRTGFNLEFDTSFIPIKKVVADLWDAKKVIPSKIALLLFSINVKITSALNSKI